MNSPVKTLTNLRRDVNWSWSVTKLKAHPNDLASISFEGFTLRRLERMRLKERGLYSHNCNKFKKLICSRQKYQENLRIAEYIDSYPNVDNRTPLDYNNFEIDFEQDEKRNQSLVNQTRN